MRQTFDETTDPSFGGKRLPLVRQAMAEQGLDGFIVPHEDEHQNEYLPAANDRLGWLTGPESLIGLLVSLNLVTTYGLTDFVSRTAIEALENGFGVQEIAARYAARRAVFLDAMHGMNDVTVRGSDGGMYVMLDVRAIEPDCEKFAWAFLEAEKGLT